MTAVSQTEDILDSDHVGLAACNPYLADVQFENSNMLDLPFPLHVRDGADGLRIRHPAIRTIELVEINGF